VGEEEVAPPDRSVLAELRDMLAAFKDIGRTEQKLAKLVRKQYVSIQSQFRDPFVLEVYVPQSTKAVPKVGRTGKSGIVWMQWQPDSSGGIRLDQMTSSNDPAVVPGLLRHLKWLHDNLGESEHAQYASVSATALRLRAETCRDGCPDAITPKTVRRQLRKYLDNVIDVTRDVCAAGFSSKSSKGSPKVIARVKRTIAATTRFALGKGLFDGRAEEWREASSPMSLEELQGFLASPHKDDEAALARTPAYRRRLAMALQAIATAGEFVRRAKTPAQKKEASGLMEVAAAMLAQAHHGCPEKADVRDGRRRDTGMVVIVVEALRRSTKS